VLDSLHNGRRVLRAIWSEPGISRVSIAQSLELNKSTVTKIVGELLSDGMVVEGESGEAGPTGGRKPVGLTLQSRYGCFAGITVRPDCYEAALLDFAGNPVLHMHTPREMVGANLLPALLDALDTVIAEAPVPVIGAGIGIGGIVNPDQGILLESIPMGISEPLSLRGPLAERAGCPVYIENDANTICWGELMNPARPDLTDFVCALGEYRFEGRKDEVSVGLGFALAGRVHYGREFSSGEFRSPFWEPGRAGQFGLADDIVAQAHSNPEALDQLVSEMAVSLAFLVNTLDLSHVFLEGFFTESFERNAATVKESLRQYWPYPGPPGCTVERASGGEHALSQGAAALAQHDYYGRFTVTVNGRHE